jgi:hypothetical protein
VALKTVHRTLFRAGAGGAAASSSTASVKRRLRAAGLTVQSSWEERLASFRDAFVDAMLYDAEMYGYLM